MHGLAPPRYGRRVVLRSAAAAGRPAMENDSGAEGTALSPPHPSPHHAPPTRENPATWYGVFSPPEAWKRSLVMQRRDRSVNRVPLSVFPMRIGVKGLPSLADQPICPPHISVTWLTLPNRLPETALSSSFSTIRSGAGYETIRRTILGRNSGNRRTEQ
jgi:hypothetical protein